MNSVLYAFKVYYRQNMVRRSLPIRLPSFLDDKLDVDILVLKLYYVCPHDRGSCTMVSVLQSQG